MKDIFPIQELNLKVTAVAGYQSGYTTNMPRNLVHEKVSSNFLTTITEEEGPLNVYYMIEFSSPEKIHRQDFEDLYFLPDDKLGSIERRVILINYWNQEEIGCYKVNTSNNKDIKVHINKNKIDYKEFVPRKGSSSHIFLSQDDYGLRTESSFVVGEYLGISISSNDNGEIKFFLGKR